MKHPIARDIMDFGWLGMLDLYDEFSQLVARLDDAGIEYALCGGLALAVFGEPRATVDVDIMIAPEAFDSAKSVAREAGFLKEALPMSFAQGAIEMRRFSKRDPETGDWLSLDLLLVTQAIRDVWTSRQDMPWENRRLCVVSREGLIRLKQIRGSAVDLEDIRKLEGNVDHDG